MSVAPACSAVERIIEKARSLFSCDPHPWQIHTWNQLLHEKRDTIVIAGTGSGKSLIFQLLCFARPGGVVLVVTPVKALMYDQVIFRLLRTDARCKSSTPSESKLSQ